MEFRESLTKFPVGVARKKVRPRNGKRVEGEPVHTTITPAPPHETDSSGERIIERFLYGVNSLSS